jgi:hypothetical protein
VTAFTGKAATINPELVSANAPIGTPLNGVIDEFAYINQGTLSDARIAQLYAYSQTNWADSGFTLVTNTAPTARPSLSFSPLTSNTLNLSWSGSATGYYLEYTTNLAAGIWLSNAAAPSVLNGTNFITQPVGGEGNLFFRLHHP